MTRFHIGDLVMVRPDLENGIPYASDGEEHPYCCFVTAMNQYRGRVYEVERAKINPTRYNLKGCGNWMFTDSMLFDAGDNRTVYHLDLDGFLEDI